MKIKIGFTCTTVEEWESTFDAEDLIEALGDDLSVEAADRLRNGDTSVFPLGKVFCGRLHVMLADSQDETPHSSYCSDRSVDSVSAFS